MFGLASYPRVTLSAIVVIYRFVPPLSIPCEQRKLISCCSVSFLSFSYDSKLDLAINEHIQTSSCFSRSKLHCLIRNFVNLRRN